MYECRGRQDAESGHERARDAPDQRVEQALEFLARRRHNAMAARALAVEGVHAVEREDMDMEVEIEGRSVPLYEGHGTGRAHGRIPGNAD
jgi:hypothetical protein